MILSPRLVNEGTRSRARRRNGITSKFDWNTTAKNMSSPTAKGVCIPSVVYWDPLIGILESKDTDASVLAAISKDFPSGCVLHEAVCLGAPDDVLMLLAKRLPFTLTQVDGNGNFPLHVACSIGASSEFVAHASPCILHQSLPRISRAETPSISCPRVPGCVSGMPSLTLRSRRT